MIQNKLKKLSLSDIAGIALIAIFTYLYTKLGFENYRYFETGLDLGGYTQALFNLSHLRLPFNTFKNMVMWGDHAHFIIAVLAPFYRILPDARLILAVQALSVTLAGWPLYKISRLLVKNVFFSLSILYAYLAFIGIQYALNFDFHPSVLTGSAIIWFFYGIHFKKRWIFWTALILGFMTREDAPPIFFMIGLYLLILALGKTIYLFFARKLGRHVSNEGFLYLRKRILTALAVMVISFGYFCLVAYVLMPMWMTDNIALSYLDTDQKDPYNVVRGFFQYPKAIFQNMTDTEVKRATYNTLFSSFGYLSLFSPFTYISSLTIFYSRFASPDSYRWIINNHSNANVLPILAIGAIYGAYNLRKIIDRMFSLAFKKSDSKKTTVLSGIATIFFALLLVYSVHTNAWGDKKAPLYFKNEKHVMKESLIPIYTDAVRKVREIIPPDDMIAASGGFTAHLGNRTRIQNYPDVDESTKWLVLGTSSYAWPFSSGSMKHEIRVTLEDERFEKVWSEKDVYIFKRRNDTQ